MTERADYTGEPGPTGPAGPAGADGPTVPPCTTTWAGITDKPSTFTPEAHASTHEAAGSDILKAASYVNRFTRPGRLYASNGTTLKKMNHREYSYQDTPENNDKIQMFFICNGTETRLELAMSKNSGSAIFDLYVNDVLDSSAYDNYGSLAVILYREILLSRPIVAGLNVIELRVNGKNALSSNYFMNTYGANLQ